MSQLGTWPCGRLRLPDEPCPYVAWHLWAGRKMRTHRQVLCPQCLRWHLWVRRNKVASLALREEK